MTVLSGGCVLIKKIRTRSVENLKNKKRSTAPPESLVATKVSLRDPGRKGRY